MNNYKTQFIDNALDSGALKFGQFRLKSGLITDAMMKGKAFVFIQPNPKRGKSAKRYAVYSAATTFAGPCR